MTHSFDPVEIFASGWVAWLGGTALWRRSGEERFWWSRRLAAVELGMALVSWRIGLLS